MPEGEVQTTARRREAAQHKGEKKRSVSQLREALSDDGDDEGPNEPSVNGGPRTRRLTRHHLNGLTKPPGGPSALSQRKSSSSASSSTSSASSATKASGGKRDKRKATAKQTTAAVKTVPPELSEDQQTVKIVTRIDELTGILDKAGAPAIKASRASILSDLSTYIEQLRSRNLHRESETCESFSKFVSVAASSNPAFVNDEKLEQVDYRLVFLQSSVPMAVTALDGKILACNERFVAGSGAKVQAKLLSKSLFDLAKPSKLQDIFSCIGTLLRSEQAAPCGDVVDALHASPSTMSIVYVKPSSLVVSLVETLPSDTNNDHRIAGAAPVFADAERDLAVLEKHRAPDVDLGVAATAAAPQPPPDSEPSSPTSGLAHPQAHKICG